MSARDYPTSSSDTNTPPQSLSNSWSMPATVSHAVSGLLRRFSSEAEPKHTKNTPPPSYDERNNGLDGVYTPPYRTASPFQPPPLYPVVLKGHSSSTQASARLLSRGLAEEIRLLVPARLQLSETWRLVYSLEEDGVSLGTLYKKCEELRGLRNGFVLVVKDGEGSVCSAAFLLVPLTVTDVFAIVVWSLPDRCTSCLAALFRYRRMFSLESKHIIWLCSCESTTPSFGRYHQCGSKYHDIHFFSVSSTPFSYSSITYHALFAISEYIFHVLSPSISKLTFFPIRYLNTRTNPLQSVSLFRSQ